MKRYLLFAFSDYYPAGGWNDFVGSFDTVEEAMDNDRRQGADGYQVVDSQTGEVIKSVG